MADQNFFSIDIPERMSLILVCIDCICSWMPTFIASGFTVAVDVAPLIVNVLQLVLVVVTPLIVLVFLQVAPVGVSIVVVPFPGLKY